MVDDLTSSRRGCVDRSEMVDDLTSSCRGCVDSSSLSTKGFDHVHWLQLAGEYNCLCKAEAKHIYLHLHLVI